MGAGFGFSRGPAWDSGSEACFNSSIYKVWTRRRITGDKIGRTTRLLDMKALDDFWNLYGLGLRAGPCNE
jgi:hypothetical protein